MFRRRYGKRKRIFRRGYNRTGGFYGRATKRRRFARRIGRRPESKFLDLSLSDTSLAASAQFLVKTGAVEATTQTLNDIAVGTGESQRIGRKLTITKILIRLGVEFTAAQSSDLLQARVTHETIRVMLYWDKQANGNENNASTMAMGGYLRS